MLSKKFKEQLKRIAVSTTLAISTVVVLFGMGANLDSIVNTVREQIARINASEIKAENEVYLTTGSNGYGLDIIANNDAGVNKVEVYQGSTKVKEINYGGSNDIEYARVELNSIPFGSEQTITIKVNGNIIDTKTITNTRYISTAQDLVAFRNSVNAGNTYVGKTVELINDIDLSSVCSSILGSWVPIGNSNTDFNGIFNGNYRKIKNLYIKTNGQTNIGLFGINKRNNKIIDA